MVPNNFKFLYCRMWKVLKLDIFRCQIHLENRNLSIYKCKLETFSYKDGGQHSNNVVFTQKKLATLVTFFYVQPVVYWVFLSLIVSQVCHSIELSCFFCHFNGIVFPTISIPHFQSNLQFIFLHLCNQYIYIYIYKHIPHVRKYEVVPCNAFLEVLFI